ncbi:MAG: Trk system potassium transporter TrkA [Bryobacteraceae bacterium]|nr:Trk system potassium transporter TrkA [Bryobacteraceae bacterium]MCX7604334.1 Trk system potassium transporter TrkA [Bryobacteraceae bacterium]
MRIVVAGGGGVGELVSRRLVREGNEVTIIEPNPDRCAHLNDALDARVVEGDAASFRTLRAAGLAAADMFIAITNDDRANLLACLAAQSEFGVPVKVARVRSHEVEDWREACRRTGLKIDLLIHPESELSRRILPVLGYPGITDILDFAEGKIRLFGMFLERGHWLAGKTLVELARMGPPKHSLVVMILRGSQVIIPRGQDALQVHDHVYALTRTDEFPEMLKFLGLEQAPKVERVFILGGKQLGILVAEELERQGVRVKLFETDAARCEKVAALLKDTMVVHGDGTDAATLIEEGIEGVDAYLALTNEDEQNLIAAMLARRLGARKLVALINRLNYLPLAHRLGIHSTVSLRLATVDRILQFARRGDVQSVTTFGDEAAEAIELMAPAGWRHAGRRLRDVEFPREVVAGALLKKNGEVVVPRGNDVIEEGDRILFFTSEKALPKLEEMMAASAGRRGLGGLWRR